MLARLCKIEGIENYVMLLSNGYMREANEVMCATMLNTFKHIEFVDMFRLGNERWDTKCEHMEDVEGETFAYITDDHELVIKDFKPFESLIDQRREVEYVSVKEYAELHGKSEPMIKILCRENRLQGAKRIGDRVYIIPRLAPYPVDNRFTQGGKYSGINRRK